MPKSGDTCKVVFGSCSMGFKDVTPPMAYAACVEYLKAHIDEVAVADADPHYTDTLDIMNVDTGRLMSYVL